MAERCRGECWREERGGGGTRLLRKRVAVVRRMRVKGVKIRGVGLKSDDMMSLKLQSMWTTGYPRRYCA